MHLITDRPAEIEGVKIHIVNEGRKIFSYLGEVFEVRKIVDKIKPDILHAHYANRYGFLSFLKIILL